MWPQPALPEDGKQVLVDIEEKTNKEITEHIKKIFGKSIETLEREQQAKKVLHPATFGPKKYHLRECMCEIEGQVPCPGRVPLPKEMTGKYKTAMKAAAASK
ncbi:28S ribosomal protein S25, mitochondrial [Alligator mississippiensis]|uniref:28S ribosomal protein S25, mitochondrial n=1 Tax=Alligator mississippiensis TaxID=8496 RepID=A0A151MK20_ALLMI|nr:28S ribosomal protein S25, mitochondrial [Alligator mississippiensis]